MNKQKTIILLIIIALFVLLGGVVIYRQQLGIDQNQQEGILPSPTVASEVDQSSILSVNKSPALGSYFTDTKGMTLYTFTKDTPSVSKCEGACLTTWPPYLAKSTQTQLPAKLGVLKRSDGSMQYTWNQMPLYYYNGDTQPGQTNGNGYNGLWMVAK